MFLDIINMQIYWQISDRSLSLLVGGKTIIKHIKLKDMLYSLGKNKT